MRAPSKESAHDILETVPAVMRFIRAQVRQRRAAGLSLPQFRTLAYLSRVKSSSLSDVADYLGLSPPAMSRLVNGLVAGRLAGRKTVSTNRRQIALTLTAQGRRTLERVRGEVRLGLADAVKELSAGEQETVQRGLRILRRVFDQPSACGQSGNGGGR